MGARCGRIKREGKDQVSQELSKMSVLLVIPIKEATQLQTLTHLPRKPRQRIELRNKRGESAVQWSCTSGSGNVA